MEKRKYKFEVGEVINKSLMSVEQIVLPKKDIKAKTGYSNQKGYKYHCLECGYEAENFEYMLIRGKNCPCCINKVIIPEINSIIAKEETRWMAEYFVNKEEAKLNKKKSSKYIDAKCPYCEERKRVNIQTLYECKSIGCLCSSGSSFGEKLMRSLLENLNINYVEEYTPRWFGLGLKRYDFYLPEYNTIIEIHGGQHYPGKKKQWRSYEEVHENDMFKFDMAIINGIENYIIINPKIVSQSEELIYVGEGEGCLSVNREVDGIVPRSARVTVEYNDYNGDTYRIRVREDIAVAFQHEIDHLDGILFVDKIDKKNPFKDKELMREI